MLNGKPHYLFDTKGFRKNIEELQTAFLSHYMNSIVAYSFKTNYLEAACKTVRDCGGYAEVVSQYEYQYAKALGFSLDRIIYNGVIPSEMKFIAILCNGIVNVDNLDEFRSIEEMAEYNRAKMRVGVRVNMDLGKGTSRFGVDLESKDFEEIMERIKASEYLTLGGFHSHVHGTRAVRYWETRAEALIKLAKTYGASYIDLGGGLWGKMPETLLTQFKERPNTYAEYGERLGSLFKREFPNEEVALIVEPGIGLVGSAMDCVSHVVSVKSIRGKQFVQLDINGASTAFDYNCDANGITKPFHIERTGRGETYLLENADMVGTTCVEDDVLVRNFNGELTVGDTIVFENIGAYSLVTSRQFITPRLGVYDKENYTCLRKAENFSDMFDIYLDHRW